MADPNADLTAKFEGILKDFDSPKPEAVQSGGGQPSVGGDLSKKFEGVIKDFESRPSRPIQQPPSPAPMEAPRSGGDDLSGRPDYTDKYNTPLTAQEETQFQEWAKSTKNAAGGMVINDLPAYDVRGRWKQLQGMSPEERAKAMEPGAHGPDTWKKPSHPTFSDESIYHGVDGHYGGHWNGEEFTPPDQGALATGPPETPEALSEATKESVKRMTPEEEAALAPWARNQLEAQEVKQLTPQEEAELAPWARKQLGDEPTTGEMAAIPGEPTTEEMAAGPGQMTTGEMAATLPEAIAPTPQRDISGIATGPPPGIEDPATQALVEEVGQRAAESQTALDAAKAMSRWVANSELNKGAAAVTRGMIDVLNALPLGIEGALNIATGRTGADRFTFGTEIAEKTRRLFSPQEMIDQAHPVTRFVGQTVGGLLPYMVLPALGAEEAVMGVTPMATRYLQTPMQNLMHTFTKNLLNFSTTDVVRTVGQGGSAADANEALLKSIPTAALFTIAQSIPYSDWVKHPWLLKAVEGVGTGWAFTAMPVLEGETDPVALATHFLTGWGIHAVTSGPPSRAQMGTYRYQRALQRAYDNFKAQWEEQNGTFEQIRVIMDRLNDSEAEVNPPTDQNGRPVTDSEVEAISKLKPYQMDERQQFIFAQIRPEPPVPTAEELYPQLVARVEAGDAAAAKQLHSLLAANPELAAAGRAAPATPPPEINTKGDLSPTSKAAEEAKPETPAPPMVAGATIAATPKPIEAKEEPHPIIQSVADKLGITPDEAFNAIPEDIRDFYKPENQDVPIAKAFREAMAQLEPEKSAALENEATVKMADSIFKADTSKPGECYRNAAVFARENGGTYVEGTVLNPGNGKKINHAWVEKDGMVYDPTVQLVLPKDDYYDNVVGAVHGELPGEEASIRAIREKSYGPFFGVPEEAAAATKIMTPEEAAREYIRRETTPGQGSWEGAAIDASAKSIAKMARRLAKSEWKGFLESLTPKDRKGKKHTKEASRELRFLEEIGYAQKAWDMEGNTYWARADVPLREGLFREGEHPDSIKAAQALPEEIAPTPNAIPTRAEHIDDILAAAKDKLVKGHIIINTYTKSFSLRSPSVLFKKGDGLAFRAGNKVYDLTDPQIDQIADQVGKLGLLDRGIAESRAAEEVTPTAAAPVAAAGPQFRSIPSVETLEALKVGQNTKDAQRIQNIIDDIKAGSTPSEAWAKHATKRMTTRMGVEEINAAPKQIVKRRLAKTMLDAITKQLEGKGAPVAPEEAAQQAVEPWNNEEILKTRKDILQASTSDAIHLLAMNYDLKNTEAMRLLKAIREYHSKGEFTEGSPVAMSMKWIKSVGAGATHLGEPEIAKAKGTIRAIDGKVAVVDWDTEGMPERILLANLATPGSVAHLDERAAGGKPGKPIEALPEEIAPSKESGKIQDLMKKADKVLAKLRAATEDIRGEKLTDAQVLRDAGINDELKPEWRRYQSIMNQIRELKDKALEEAPTLPEEIAPTETAAPEAVSEKTVQKQGWWYIKGHEGPEDQKFSTKEAADKAADLAAKWAKIDWQERDRKLAEIMGEPDTEKFAVTLKAAPNKIGGNTYSTRNTDMAGYVGTEPPDKAFEGSRTTKKSGFLADESMVIRKDALSGASETARGILSSASGEKPYPEEAVLRVWDNAVSQATVTYEILGVETKEVRPERVKKGGKWVDVPQPSIETVHLLSPEVPPNLYRGDTIPGQNTVPLNKGKFDLIMQSTGADTIKKGERLSDPVVFFKDGHPVAALMPTMSEVRAYPGIPEDKFSVNTLEKWAKKATKEAVKRGLDVEDIVKNIDQMRQLGEIFKANPDLILSEDLKSSPLRANADYIKTMDFDINCPRREEYAATLKVIEDRLDRPMNSDELFGLALKLQIEGRLAPCIFCYVEGGRRAFNEGLFKFQQKVDPTIDMGRFRQWWDAKVEGGSFPVSPEEAKQFDAARKYAQACSMANLPKPFSPYRGQLFNWAFQKTLEEINKRAGLRYQSNNDFRIQFVIDYMQSIIDLSILGSKAHAYSKINDFVRIFGRTGMRIAQSCFIKEENGSYVSDIKNGMDWAEARANRELFPDDAGIIMVTTTDAQTRWAMAQDWVDQVIPFHRSGMTKDQFAMLHFQDYSSKQTETWINKKEHYEVDPETGKKTYLKPPHFNYDAHGNDKDTYLKLCADVGANPRFKEFVNDPGYMKLITDFVNMEVPQSPLKPIFDYEYAEKALQEYIKTHKKIEVSQDIVNDMIDRIDNNKAMYNVNQMLGLTELPEEAWREGEEVTSGAVPGREYLLLADGETGRRLLNDYRTSKESDLGPGETSPWSSIDYSEELAARPVIGQINDHLERAGITDITIVPAKNSPAAGALITAADGSRFMILDNRYGDGMMMQVAAHEVFHERIKRGDREAQALVAAVDIRSDVFRQYSELINREYADLGLKPLDMISMMEEVAADYAAGIRTLPTENGYLDLSRAFGEEAKVQQLNAEYRGERKLAAGQVELPPSNAPPDAKMAIGNAAQAPEVAAAIKNTVGAEITPEGRLSMTVLRYQPPYMAGTRAVRSGLFYLPPKTSSERYYKGANRVYGGSERYELETEYRNPLFVKAGTGGKAPERAYDLIMGKGAYQAMREDVLKTTRPGYVRVSDNRAAAIEDVEAILKKYGGNPDFAYDIVENNRHGNTLAYAIQEHIVAHALRDAGFDSVIGYTPSKGSYRLSEVFDFRDEENPWRAQAKETYDEFYEGRPEGVGLLEVVPKPGKEKFRIETREEKAQRYKRENPSLVPGEDRPPTQKEIDALPPLKIPTFDEFTKDPKYQEILARLKQRGNREIPLYEGQSFLDRGGNWIRDEKGRKRQLTDREIYQHYFDPKGDYNYETPNTTGDIYNPPPGTIDPPPNQTKLQGLIGKLKALRQSWNQTFSARNISEVADRTQTSIVENLGWGAGQMLKTLEALDKFHTRFKNLTRDEFIDFIQTVELNKLEEVKAMVDAGDFDPKLYEAAVTWRTIADELHDLIANTREKGEFAYWENFFPRMFKDPEKAAAAIEPILAMARRSMTGTEAMLKARTMLTLANSIKPVEQGGLGLELAYDNYIDMMKAKAHEAIKYLSGRYIIDDMIAAGFLMKQKEKPEEGVPQPKKPVGWVEFQDKSLRGYWAHPDVALVLDNFLSRGFKGNALFDFIDNPTSALREMFVGLSAFHGFFTTLSYLSHGIGSNLPRALGAAMSGRWDAAAGHIKSMGESFRIKHSLNFGGEIIQAMRNPDSASPAMREMIDLMQRAGVRVNDSGWLEIWGTKGTPVDLTSMSNSIAEAFEQSKFGIPRKVIRSISWPIMNYFVPRLKLAAMAKSIDMELRAVRAEKEAQGKFLSELETTKIVQKIGKKMDDIFGMMVYDNLGMNRAMKDVLRQLIGFPGWNIGSGSLILESFKGISHLIEETSKQGAGLITGERPAWTKMDMKQRMSLEFYMGMLVVSAIAGTLTMKLLTGKWPTDAKDIFMPQTGGTLANGQPERVRMPTYLRDVLSLNHPVDMVAHKLNFPLRMFQSLTANQDYFGEQIRDPYAAGRQQALQTVEYIGKSFLPFGVQGMIKAETPKSKALNILGITPVPREYSNTEAQNVIDEYNKLTRASTTSKESAELKRLKKDLRDLARAGDESKFQEKAEEAIDTGAITHQQVKAIVEESKLPPGLGRFTSLPLEWALRAWDKANEREQEMWRPFLLKKFMSEKPENLIKNREAAVKTLQDMGENGAAEAVQNLQMTERSKKLDLTGLGVVGEPPEIGSMEAVDEAIAAAINKKVEEPPLKFPKRASNKPKKNPYSVLGL